MAKTKKDIKGHSEAYILQFSIEKKHDNINNNPISGKYIFCSCIFKNLTNYTQTHNHMHSLYYTLYSSLYNFKHE